MTVESRRQPRSSRTLAELLFTLNNILDLEELERYRVAYENEFSKTDLTRRFTSTWAPDQQIWMIEHHPERYFDGLPPFVKAFIKGKMQMAARDGDLDDMPAVWLQLFVRGKMDLGELPPGRSR